MLARAKIYRNTNRPSTAPNSMLPQNLPLNSSNISRLPPSVSRTTRSRLIRDSIQPRSHLHPKRRPACATDGIPYLMPGDACNTIGHTTNKFATKTNESAMNALMLPKAIKLETKVHAGTQTTNPTQRDAVSNVENVRLLQITGDKSSLCDALEASKDSTSTSLSTPF